MTKRAAKPNGTGAAPGGLSALALSRLIGCNRNTLTTWAERDGCPAVTRADPATGTPWTFDPPAVIAWLQQRAAERAAAPLRERVAVLEAALAESGEAAAAGISEAEARRRKRALEAELLAHELAVKRGEWIPAHEVDTVLIALMTMTKQRILAVPNKTAVELAAESTPGGCFAIVERELYEALTSLADAAEKAQRAQEAGEVSGIVKHGRRYMRQSNGYEAEGEDS